MKNKLNLLQAIRGIAATLVVFHHVSSSSGVYFNAVWFFDFFNSSRALDIFFVLSGFIITYIHFNDLQTRTNVKAFFFRRFNRIYPVFWIVSLVYLAFYIAVKTYSLHDIGSGFMIKSFLLIDPNIPMVRVAWTLSYEVVFYLVFGLCITMGLRFAKVTWLLWLLITIVCYFVLPEDSIPYPFRNFILGILIGCFAGYVLSVMPLNNMAESAIKFRYKSLLSAGMLISIVMWAVTFLTDFGQKTSLESRVILGTGAALIILGSAIADLHKNIKVPKLLLIVGDASYLIYLTHYLVLALFFKAAMRYPQMHSSGLRVFLLGACAAIVAVVSGVIAHQIIEKPVSRFLNRISLNKKPNLEFNS